MGMIHFLIPHFMANGDGFARKIETVDVVDHQSGPDVPRPERADPSPISLQDSLKNLKAIEKGAKEMDTNQAVEAVVAVVISLRENSVVQKLAEYWDAKTQVEQLAMVKDPGLLQRFLESIVPILPLAKMPRDLRASFFRALLYYGVLEFNPMSEKAGGLKLVDSKASETLIRELESQAKGSESFGLILVRGAAFLAGQVELFEVATILARLFEGNRRMAALVRVRVHEHDRMMAELNEGKDRGAAAAQKYKEEQMASAANTGFREEGA